MRAGDLRHRVTLQQKSATKNSFGEEVVAWTNVCTVWASVEPLRGREFLEGKQMEAEVNTRIRMRYRAGVVPTMRAAFGAHTYDIQDVIHLQERGRELQLMCNEVL